jgi:hypothetical protein
MLIPAISLRLLSSLMVMALPLGLGAEEEIRLVSGEVLVGQWVRESDSDIELLQTVLVDRRLSFSTIVVPKDQIAQRSLVQPPRDQYQDRAAKVVNNVDGHCELARWCLDRCLLDRALAHVQQADAIDRQNAKVAALFAELGYVKAQDQWIRQVDAAPVAEPESGGKPPTDADKRKSYRQALSARNALVQQVNDLTWTTSGAKAPLVEATKQCTALREQLNKQKRDLEDAHAQFVYEENSIKALMDRKTTPETFAAISRHLPGKQAALLTMAKMHTEIPLTEERLTKSQQQVYAMRLSLAKATTDLSAVKQRLEQANAEVDQRKKDLGE